MADAVTRLDRGDRLVLVFRTTDEMAAFVADRFREISDAAIAEKGYCSMALSGGKTPIDLYARLGQPGRAIDWRRIHVFLVDERFVPFTDGQSNFRMIKEKLLDAVPVPPGNVHPIQTDGTDPRVAAESYEAELVRFFRAKRGDSWISPGPRPDGARPGGAIRFDIMTLGVGEDGHTASLFPGLRTDRGDTRLVLAVSPGEERIARITLTLSVIDSAMNLFFFLRGAAKAEVAKRVIDDRDPSLPASLVEPKDGKLVFLCDREAASLLTGFTIDD